MMDYWKALDLVATVTSTQDPIVQSLAQQSNPETWRQMVPHLVQHSPYFVREKSFLRNVIMSKQKSAIKIVVILAKRYIVKPHKLE